MTYAANNGVDENGVDEEVNHRVGKDGTLPPVLLIIFNRPHLTVRVVEALRKAQIPRLFVAADGPRPDRPEDVALCAAARALIADIDWPCEVVTDFADTNMGTKRRVESAVDWALAESETAIVVEDDCVPDPSFFTFCAELLVTYREEPRVWVISGSSHLADRIQSSSSYWFSRYFDSGAWATWRRAWQLYDRELHDWPQLRASGWLRDFLGSRRMGEYWSYCMQTTYDRRHSWAYCLTLSAWRNDVLHITPRLNLVTHIGFGPDATNTKDSHDIIANLPAHTMLFPLSHPTGLARDVTADQVTEEMLFSGNLTNMLRHLQMRAKTAYV